MRIAFLIMAHHNVELLNIFIQQLLKYDESYIYIHVDKKSSIISNIIQSERVHIMPTRYSVNWGDYTQIEVVNALLKYAYSKGVHEYYSLHSGVDLCIKPVQELVTYLKRTNCYGYYECNRLPNGWQYGGGYGRIALRWPEILRKKRSRLHPLRLVRSIYGKLYAIGIIKGHKIPDKYQLYGGASWFTIRHDCASDYLKFINDNEYDNMFRYGLCCDEIYYVSIFQMCKGERSVMEHNLLTYVDWKNRGQKKDAGSPNIISMSFIDEVENSSCFFARKFDPLYDKKVIDYYATKCEICSIGVS